MRALALSFTLLLAVSCFIPLPAGAEEYSLHDLYRIALDRADTIRIAGENINFAVEERKRAVSLLIPKLSTFANYTRFSEDKWTTDTIDFQGQAVPYDILIQPSSSLSWGLKLEENISLSLRELTAVRIGSNDIRKNIFDLHAVQEDYLLQVAQSYYTVFMARKRLDIARSNVDRVTAYRDAAMSRLKVGEITETVLLRADSELSSAKSDMVKAQNALALMNATLARLAGIPQGFVLKEEPAREATEPVLADLTGTAYAERPDLKSLRYQMKIAEQQVSFSEGSYWPILSIAGVFQKADQDPMTSTVNKDSTYGSVSLVFPLFEGGLRRAEVQEAKVRQRQAALSFENQKKTVALEVERAYLDLMTRKETIVFLRDQLNFAQDNYRGVSKQFSLGLASSIDVIDANSLLVSSERQLADASYQYQLSILEVERATGTFMKEVQEKKQ
jgi:outer membrane protein